MHSTNNINITQFFTYRIMRRRTFKKQDYTEFIKTMDEKCNNNSFLKTESPKKIITKEEVDKLIENADKKFDSHYFNKFPFYTVDKNAYLDPNSFVFYVKQEKTQPPVKRQPVSKKIPEQKQQSGAYYSGLSYTSTISQIMKETANNIKESKPPSNTDSKLSGETIFYYPHPRACGRIVKTQEPRPEIKPYVPPAKRIPKTKVTIEVEIQDLDGLIKLIDAYPPDETKEYNINMEGLHKIHTSLIDLNNMIGMKELKNNVVDQILYYIQDLNKSGDFMHTVIYGPPGTGKTEIAKIIGQIFSKLGILKKGVFKKVTRSDLVAGYLGQTAIKTRDVINECLGGVLFIDEAYALGNNEKKDSFSKECIDTLCEALSNHKEDLMVIIAGYETELKECFFNYNQGLDSRFTWRFKTDEYKGEELHNIFLKKIKEIKWEIADSDAADQKIAKAWFEKNLEYFKFFGRDIETLLAKTKIVHARRVFCKPQPEKMKITMKDLEKGFELYLKNDEVKKRKEVESLKNIIKTMYV
jgi:AAA+ superfamily predicted ATPase